MAPIPERLVVLLADDDENDAILIRRAFEGVGSLAQLRRVPDGQEAIAYLQGEGAYIDRRQFPFPDVVILDHRMPRLSGLGVLCWLRSDVRFVSLPVLVFSLVLLPSEVEAANRLRAACCLKPIAADTTQIALQAGICEAFEMANATPHEAMTRG